MFPRPASKRWSSSNALMGALRPASRSARARDRGQVVEGVGTEAGRAGRRQFVGGEHRGVPEGARVHEAHLRPPSRVDHHRGVGGFGLPGRGHRHPPRHPQVGHPGEAVAHVGQEVLAPAPQRQDPPAPQAGGEILRGAAAGAGPVPGAPPPRPTTAPQSTGSRCRRVISTSGNSGIAAVFSGQHGRGPGEPPPAPPRFLEVPVPEPSTRPPSLTVAKNTRACSGPSPCRA